MKEIACLYWHFHWHYRTARFAEETKSTFWEKPLGVTQHRSGFEPHSRLQPLTWIASFLSSTR